jgi:outer membrane protein assembly factor BamE|tara:strand:+ start:112 stop:441 length:330 start_codon:yes stop_codon:yes gene_type:complete
MSRHNKNFISLILASVFLYGCSTFSFYNVPVVQGNIFNEEDTVKLEKGLTKDQVKFILGTALVQDPFHKNRWDYVNKVTVGELVVSNKKLTVFFDSNELLDSWIIEDSQ